MRVDQPATGEIRLRRFRGILKVIDMKSLAHYIQGAVGLAAVTAIGIAAPWCQALAQNRPGGAVDVPEPSSLVLIATGVVLVAAFKKFRKQN